MPLLPLKLHRARPCWNCGHDMHGLDALAFCPECGASPTPENAYVDGELLVIQNGTILPRRCVTTNKPVEGEANYATLTYNGPWVWLVGAIGAIGFLSLLIHDYLPIHGLIPGTVVAIGQLICLLYFFVIGPRRCQLAYWQQPECAAKGSRYGTLLATLLVLLMTCCSLAFAASGYWWDRPWSNTVAYYACAVLLTLAAVIAAINWRSKAFPKLARYKDGKFWLSGCGKAFLKSIEAEQQQRERGEPVANSQGENATPNADT